MNLPWYEILALIPLLGGVLLLRRMEAGRARAICIGFSGIALILALALDLTGVSADVRWLDRVSTQPWIHIDEFNRPLLPLTALIYFSTLLATVGHKAQKFSFSGALFSEAITLSTLSTDSLVWMIVLQSLGVIPIWFELKARGYSGRVYGFHQLLFVLCLILGGLLYAPSNGPAMSLSVSLLTVAVLIRSGALPFHVWRIDLFQKATFGSAILFVSPMMGAYICMRWVLPSEPDWALHTISFLSLATAVYAAGMALIQNDGRRFYCYLFLSHSSLVLVGLELATPIGIAGALSMWVSVGVALTSFGITMRCIEARVGRIDLGRYYGLYNHMPTMAAFFLLTGLASVGFPCTIGFVAGELLTESVIAYSPWVGWLVVLAMTLNGIAIMRAYFRVFTGTKHVTSIPMKSQPEERFAIIVMTLLILGGGLYPQPGVEARYRAAVHLLENYHRGTPTDGDAHASVHDAGE